MKIFSTGPAAVRRGEFAPFPGVRSRIRLIPYADLALPGADPWRGGYRKAAEEDEIVAGPGSAEPWEEALAGAPAGCVLVGPVAECEPVYGAAGAALKAAGASGRGAVLVDVLCDPGALPAGPDVVRVTVWRGDEGEKFFERAVESRGEGKAGVALPLIPGWTAEPGFLRDFLARARSAGADFAAAFEVEADGRSRAAMHADFAARFPDRSDAYFDVLHHRDGRPEIARARQVFAEEAGASGLSVRVPLPRGRADFEANLRAREALESEADRIGDPGASALRSASRRIEDFGRDLGELAREGNVRILLPPESREWALVEEALGPEKAAPRR